MVCHRVWIVFVLGLGFLVALGGCGGSSGGDTTTATGEQSALAFDSGANAHVDMGTSALFALTGTMTLEAWVKCDPTQTGPFGRFIDKFNFVAKQGFNLILNNRSAFFAFFDTGGVEHSVFGTTDIQDGQWHHVAGSWDGQTLRVYVDGNLENTNNVGAQTVSVSTNPLAVGSSDDGGGFLPLNGCIDEVRIWNVVRSDADIAAFMGQCLTGSEAGLLGYWRFDENTGTTAVDQTSNGNNGTLVNGPAWTTPPTGLSCP